MYTPPPMSPAEVDDLLVHDPFAIEDEALEVEVTTAFKNMQTAMGEEQFKAFGIAFLLKIEARLRQTMPPDSPPLQLLDEYHLLHG